MEKIMKNLFMGLFFTILLFSQARADLNCVSEDGDTLTISLSELIPPPQTQNTAYAAKVVLNSNGNTETFKGKFTANLNNYELYDAIGNSVKLQVVKPILHGGRCGRCTPDPLPNLNYYAKLTSNQNELDFTCTLIK